MFCIYKTDPDWIRTVRTLNPDIQVNFWRRNTNDFKLPLGSWFYFNQRHTRNIVGRGIMVGYEVLTLDAAWEKFGVGNGVSSVFHLKARASEILKVREEGSLIGCIILSELQFLKVGEEYVIDSSDFPPQIVSTKYFKDSELIELQEKFDLVSLSNTTSFLEQSRAHYEEGAEFFSYRIGYERSIEARQACIAHYGLNCMACKTNLESVYGPVAKGFIHVHHINPLAQTAEVRKVDPVNDLIPLCPNCHAVAHRRSPPFSLDELRGFLGV